MSQSATPATQNDMTTCLATFEKERFCSFPHRHCEATRQHVGAPKRAFRARLPPLLTLCSFKIDVFLRVFVGTSKFAIHQIDVSCEASVNFHHKMPRMPRNLHLVATWRSPCQCDLQKTRSHDTFKVLRLPRKMTMDTSKVLRRHENCNASLKTSQKYCACHTKRLSTRYKHVWMSRSATPATRNEAQRDVGNLQKWPLLKTYHRHGYNSHRADGCERLRTQTQRRANTPSAPKPPEWNGNPCYPFGKKTISIFFVGHYNCHNSWAIVGMIIAYCSYSQLTNTHNLGGQRRHHLESLTFGCANLHLLMGSGDNSVEDSGIVTFKNRDNNQQIDMSQIMLIPIIFNWISIDIYHDIYHHQQIEMKNWIFVRWFLYQWDWLSRFLKRKVRLSGE